MPLEDLQVSMIDSLECPHTDVDCFISANFKSVLKNMENQAHRQVQEELNAKIQRCTDAGKQGERPQARLLKCLENGYT